MEKLVFALSTNQALYSASVLKDSLNLLLLKPLQLKVEISPTLF